MAIFSFIINEFVVPAANLKSKALMMQALAQKNLPDGKSNFLFRNLTMIKDLKDFSILVITKTGRWKGLQFLIFLTDMIQVVQSRHGTTNPSYWGFNEGAIYTISLTGKVMNTAVFND